ncbi:hypothetical protein BD408DRAFT_414444 [Parasitella parasitica]|nr:hypothetical protein BD408DRAFT_414444 [Parasitella parasitica]
MGLMPPVSNSPTIQSNYDTLMKDAQNLITRKTNLEQELKELEIVLTSAGVGMDTPLIDNEGFPRSELDIQTIRTSRSMIHRLRNDHREIMLEIEKILHRIHQLKKANGEATADAPSSSTSNPPNNTANTAATTLTEPTTVGGPIAYAVVNAIAPDSPAYGAGLRRNDRITQFGHINSTNHDRLQAINRLIIDKEEQQIPVTILRDEIHLQIVVTPRSGWGGRGTLGCHLLPL